MKTINLEELLNKKVNIISPTVKELVLMVMKDACMQVVDLCAEEADADYRYIGEIEDRTGDSYNIEVYVLKNSILKVKEQVI